MLAKGARVKQRHGIYFYEPDIVFSEEVFTGDIEILLQVEYNQPGIGIVLSHDNGKPFLESESQFLFKLGQNHYQVIEKTIRGQRRLHNQSTHINPPLNELLLSLKKTERAVEISANNYQGAIFRLPEYLYRYKIGLYSAGENIIQDIKLHTGVPQYWGVKVPSDKSGRVFFFYNGFGFESESIVGVKQELYTDSGQKKYLLYTASNDDIIPFVRDSTQTDVYNAEDQSFEGVSPFTIGFKGVSGTVKNISVSSKPDDNYVPTHQDSVTQQPGEVRINLNNVKEMKIEATVHELGEDPKLLVCGQEILLFNDLSINRDEPVLYEFKRDADQWVLKVGEEEINLQLNDTLSLFYDMDTTITKMTVEHIGVVLDFVESDDYMFLIDPSNDSVEKEIYAIKSDLSIDIENTQNIFETDRYGNPARTILAKDAPLNYASQEDEIYLVDEQKNIKKIIGTRKFGSGSISLDLIMNLTGTKQVPGHISGPILVVDQEGNPLDISSSYRFIKQHNDLTGEIDRFYFFTNWEREIFDPRRPIILTKEPLDYYSINNIRIYGIPHHADIVPEEIFGVYHKTLDNIDMYANFYHIVEDYQIYDPYGYIVIPNAFEFYKEIVIDYLKKDTYCVNYNQDTGYFDVNISSKRDDLYLVYDFDKSDESLSGQICKKIIQNITPETSGYIVLRRDHT